MMYKIACEHRDQVSGRYADGDDPLVYLVSSVRRVVDARLTVVYTDGNCAADVSRFSTDLGELPDLVDWPLMDAERWNNVPEDPDRMRRRMAEFLVHQKFPLEAVAGFAVRSGERADEVAALLGAHGDASRYVGVRAEWYYGFGRG
jgi:hypothetical protein